MVNDSNEMINKNYLQRILIAIGKKRASLLQQHSGINTDYSAKEYYIVCTCLDYYKSDQGLGSGLIGLKLTKKMSKSHFFS